jgi:hypothetical protein
MISVEEIRGLVPNHCMQPTPQSVIKIAYTDLSPVWCTTDAGR